MSTDRNYRAHKSVCPFCGVGCGIEYSAASGKGTGWKGPVNTKGEICPKGAAAFDFVDHEDRLTQPLIKEEGEFREASWEEAFTRIESELGDIVDTHGPDSVAFFASSNATNEENYVYQKTARMLGTNNVDNCARLCHASTVAAMSERFGAGAMTNTLDDLMEADVYLVAGANPAEQHPVAFRSYFLPAIRDGGEMIHVDPRENASTEAAGIHLPVRPGYDIPLFNAMAAVILEEDLVDEAFLDERATGFEEFEAHLADLDIDETARMAGVDPDQLREAARTYAEADRAAIFTGMGMSQHICGTDNVHSLLNLALLTGNVGREGTGVNPLRGQNNVQGAGDVGALPNVLPGYQPVADDAAREQIADVWGVEPPATPGLTEVEFTHEFGDSIKGAFVFAENPAVTEPHAAHIDEAFEDVDFVAVLDLFETETAKHADVILPGSAWAEKSGTVTNTDRQVLRMRPNADLPGNARLDLEILTEVGARLTGQPDQFDYDGPADVFAELTDVSPIYAGMDFEAIGEGSQRWPFPEGAESGTTVLHRDEFSNGEKTSPLVPLEHIPPADELEEGELALTTGRVLQHFNSGALSRRSETLMRMRGEDVIQIHPEDAAERGIEDGDEVRVENERGFVEVEAAVTPAVREGAVFLTFHYADPLTNTLTGDDLDPVAKIPEYKHSGVSVKPLAD